MKETDVLFNADGSIYHLAVPFGVLPSTIITVGDQDRVKEVSKHFDSVDHTFRNREFVTHIGRMGGRPLAVVSTGIGVDNIEIVFQELDLLTNSGPDRQVNSEIKSLDILRIGTTGGIHPAVQAGSFVLSTSATGTDSLPTFYDISSAEKASLFFADNDLDDKFFSSELRPYHTHSNFASLQAGLANKVIVGHTITAPGFYGPQGRITRIAPSFSVLRHIPAANVHGIPITNLEMETSGIYTMAHVLGHRCSSISLVVANRLHDRYLANAQAAMDSLIETVLAAI